MSSPVRVNVAPWKHDASFVYSVTYDEGTIDCLSNAYPLNEKYGIPGDVAVVAGQLGEQRHVARSSLNDYFHMGPQHLRFLLAHGWSVSNHSFCHPPLADPATIDFEQEVVRSKEILDRVLGTPIPIFCSWNSYTVYDTVRAWVECTDGYIGLTRAANDAEHINAPDFDPLGIWRNRLCEDEDAVAFLPAHLSRRGFRPEAVLGMWLVDVTHLVLYETPQGHKCITPRSLEERFARLRELFGETMWAATPQEVVTYTYLRQHCHLSTTHGPPGHAELHLAFPNLPAPIHSGELTFALKFADDPGDVQALGPTGEVYPLHRWTGAYLLTCPVWEGATIQVRYGAALQSGAEESST